MNIHFNNEALFYDLQNNTVEKFIIGSKMYGTDNDNSDTDYLSIYLDPSFSYYWEHHQLQYKENNTDYNFVELRTFIRNLLTGDSTINLEILFSEQFDKCEHLCFLKRFKQDFINFNIIRSYLGQARRDLKKYVSTKDNKKLAHAFRGYIFAYQLFYRKNLDVTMETRIFDITTSDKEYYLDILNGKKISKGELKMLISDLRDKVNDAFENKKLHRMMSVEKLKELDTKIKYMYTKFNVPEIYYGDILYDVLENGLKY